MAGKVSNFSDLIQRVTASCLLDPLGSTRRDSTRYANGSFASEDDDEDDACNFKSEGEEEDGGQKEGVEKGEKKIEARFLEQTKRESRAERLVVEMENLMNEVFDVVSAMKRAYTGLQAAHCPWDPEKMRTADVAVVAELKRLGVLKERYRRSILVNGGGGGGGCEKRVAGLREVVAPYEAAVDELKREVKAKEVEVENLKEKLNSVTSFGSNGKKGRSLSKKKISQVTGAPVPEPELFEATMSQVKEASKSFTTLLLSLMRSAHWDIAAAVRSIQSAAGVATTNSSITGNHHAKYALESYVSHKIFQGFDHETFYMDGSLSSLLNPDQYRRDCFTQYRDMKAMDPVELLGILPTCPFGQFCSKKYLSIVNPKMEESLFGNQDQQNQVMAGNHPRTQFYSEFLQLAKAVWLLHLLTFSLDPAPSQFEASRGAEFYPQYMESVVKFSDGRIPAGHIVGFPVSPGFKLGNGSVIRARVYLVSRS